MLSTVLLASLRLTSLVLLLPTRVRSRVPSIPAIATSRLGRQGRRGADVLAREVNIYPPVVLLRRVLQPELAAHFLDARLDLLHVVRRVVALADNDVEMRLVPGLRVPYPRLQDILGLLDELAVQVDRVRGYASFRVVLAEDVLGRLFVVLLHLGGVLLALVREVLGLGAIAALVGLVGLVKAITAFRGLGTRQVAQPIILGLDVGVRVVMGEGC